MRTALIVIGVLGIVVGVCMQLAAVGFLGWLGDAVDDVDRKSGLNMAGRVIAVLGLLLAWGTLRWE